MLTLAVIFYNEEKELKTCIDSILLNIDYIDRVILHDNGSTDNAEEICREIVAKNKDKFEYIKQDVNRGAYYNPYYLANIDIKTEYIMLMRPRDKIPAGYIKSMLDTLKQNPGSSACCPNFYFRTKSYLDTNGFIYSAGEDQNHPDPFTRIISFLKYGHLHATTVIYGVIRTTVFQEAYNDIEFYYKGNLLVPRSPTDFAPVFRFLEKGPFCMANQTYLYKIWTRDAEDIVPKQFRYAKAFGYNPLIDNVKFIYEDALTVLKRIPNKPPDWEEQFHKWFCTYTGYDDDGKPYLPKFLKKVASYYIRKYMGYRMP